jgi:2-polyprenyl-3-methyl-5-hydroxy-6-metoxy-1,4-benzoquinol methylase
MVQSPVTGGSASLCDEYRCADLIARYKNDWSLDVAEHFKGMNRLSLYRCKDTGYRFFHPASLAGEADFYDEFWALENPNIHRPKGIVRDDWQFALDRIRPGEKVLDVGCAEGAFLEHASNITVAEGIDENAEGCRLAIAGGLKASCAKVADFANDHPKSFDVVVASQVLEHVYDVAAFMNGLIRLVRPGGRIILCVPNNEPYYVGWTKYDPLNNPPHHIGMWNEASLRSMAAYFGLKIDEVGHLGNPDRFPLQVYRRAAYLADVTKAPNQLKSRDWLRIAVTTPIALILTLKERAVGSTSNHAYVSIVLRKPKAG